MAEHCREVEKLSAQFARAFGSEDWARFMGLLHDYGKARPSFQAKLAKETGYDPTARNSGDTQHSIAGAVAAMDALGSAGLIAAYVIAGHHAGLADWQGGPGSLVQRLKNRIPLEEAALYIPWELTAPAQPTSPPPGEADPALWIRMLFSCLVDADRLNTEGFMTPDKAAARKNYPSLAELQPFLNKHLSKLVADADPTPINEIRKQILHQCRAKAVEEPGLFSLTVPTGGGKTLSSLAFALDHAKAKRLDRIIYVIPYTSIIEQTVNTFRQVFQPLGDVVIEHHSNMDPDKGDKLDTGQDDQISLNDLASENWDGPLIVTTAVQFFESLFAAKPTRCRKLHNIVNCVVVLDEVQLLPPRFLKPILHVLDDLHRHYGTTIVLCTATQPCLAGINSLDFKFKGLPGAREMVNDPEGLHRQLKRVEVKLPHDLNAATPLEEIAKRMAAEGQSCLTVVNTRKQARELFELLPEDAFHLSAQMCGQHRSEVIDQIRERLADEELVLVVSTQLIECGVDLDFPVVYRALAGLDSLAQAAGRCNREGKLNNGQGKGLLHVFIPPGGQPPGHLSQAADATRSVLIDRPADCFHPDLFRRFFRHLFWTKGEELDAEGIMGLLAPDAKARFSFRTAARKFRIIDNNDVSVVTMHGQGEELIEQLRRQGPDRDLFRRMQRYTVNLPHWLATPMINRGDLEEVFGVTVQNSSLIYNPFKGLLTEPDSVSDPNYFTL